MEDFIDELVLGIGEMKGVVLVGIFLFFKIFNKFVLCLIIFFEIKKFLLFLLINEVLCRRSRRRRIRSKVCEKYECCVRGYFLFGLKYKIVMVRGVI